jgi:hypothetical protein
MRGAKAIASVVLALITVACSTPSQSPSASGAVPEKQLEPAGTAAVTPSATAPAPGQQAPAAATGAPANPTPATQTNKVVLGVGTASEFHCPSTGTVIRTSTGRMFQFTEAKGSRCAYTDEGGNTRERYALFVDGFGQLARKEMDRLWPLSVGGRTDFDVVDMTPVQPTDRFSQRHFHESFVVTRQERVTLPAGRFDSFVVEWTETEIGRHHDKTEAVVTMWYAPQVGYVVKSSVRLVNANAADPYATTQYARMTYEATEVVMPNGQSLPVATGEPTVKAPGSEAPAPRTPPALAAPAATPAPASPATRLKTLRRLLDQKLITPQEYETRRKAILDSL